MSHRRDSLAPLYQNRQRNIAFEFLGLIGLSDPARPSVPGAIRACYDAGALVIKITGDYPGAALTIARQIGLRPAVSAITCAAFAQ